MLTLRPLILAQGRLARLVLSGLTPGEPYRLVLTPVRDKGAKLEQRGMADAQGRLAWEQAVVWRGAVLCDVFAGQSIMPLARLHAYAAPPELAARHPLRCDFHIHTTYSDGKDSVAEMVVRGRELGLDALAITDHNHYAGSWEAIQITERTGLGLLCLPGEEVSASAWHVLSIGASAQVGAPPERDNDAGLSATVERIHQLGGRAFLAHPYWRTHGYHHLPSGNYDLVLNQGGLDGVELFGDVEWEDNVLSLARYAELADKLPILGNSDTHGTGHTYGGYWTLVWAAAVTRDGILDAIAARRSAACALAPLAPAAQPLEVRPLFFGPYELVDWALFLYAHYFPLHDAVCRREAQLARRVLAGEALPSEAMAQVRAELEALKAECWERV